ncbi:MAG: Card1-like endonuclease domain-containing protein [Sarcina sp.]
MEFDLLINIFDVHNEASILLTEKYKPKNILFFYRKDEEKVGVENLRQYYLEKFPSCSFKFEKLDIDNTKSIESAITQYEGIQGLCNLTSGKKLVTLMVYSFCIKHHINCVYVDIKNCKFIYMNEGNITIKNNNIADLQIEDIITSIGGSIVVDSTNDYDEKILLLTEWVSKNIEDWSKFKVLLQDVNIFKRDENDLEVLFLDKNKIDDNRNLSIVENAISYMQSNGLMDIQNYKDKFKIILKNDFIKTFLFKSGTWLEILTKNIVDNIEGIDQVKSGVLFLWNNKDEKVRNELDVVAMKDSVMICISCKDSKKYDEIALNELDIYAQQVGGENVIKILVATSEAMKGTIRKRAQEMGIEIIVFDGDINKFQNSLSVVINKKRETS